MISRLHGTLLECDMDRIEIATQGGVVYEVEVPVTVAGRLPTPGSEVRIRTVQIVREDSVALYGFLDVHERELFRRLLTASGVGAKLALAMLSTFSAHRLARALVDKEIAVLTQVSGVGKKKAERLVLELADRVQDLAIARGDEGSVAPGAEEAIAALMALGYTFAEADESVRKVLDGDGPANIEEIVKRALASR